MNKSPRTRRLLSTLAVVSWLATTALATGTETEIVYPLQRVPAGTTVVDAEASRWNRLILLATPALTSGEIDRLPSGLQQAVPRFSFTILATVFKLPPDSGGDPTADGPSANYRLAEVGVGYSALLQGRQVIVSAAEDQGAGANLGFIDRQVLGQNETELEKRRVVVRSSTLMMFDMVAILSRDGGHRDETVRHLVWIDPQTGQPGLATWLVQQGAGGGTVGSSTVEDDPLRVFPAGMRGTNRIHVDSSTFFLGLPTVRTFGLERLIPGRPVEWTQLLRRLAGRSTYSSETLAEFAAALNAAITATPRQSGTTE